MGNCCGRPTPPGNEQTSPPPKRHPMARRLNWPKKHRQSFKSSSSTKSGAENKVAFQIDQGDSDVDANVISMSNVDVRGAISHQSPPSTASEMRESETIPSGQRDSKLDTVETDERKMEVPQASSPQSSPSRSINIMEDTEASSQHDQGASDQQSPPSAAAVNKIDRPHVEDSDMDNVEEEQADSAADEAQADSSRPSSSAELQPQETGVSLDNFIFHKALGSGGFGAVSDSTT